MNMKKRKKIIILILIFVLFSFMVNSCITPPDIDDTTTSKTIADSLKVTDLSSIYNSSTSSYTFSWKTQELAESIFYYGTSDNDLSLSVVSEDNKTDRTILISDLIVGTTYYYKIVSEINDYQKETNVLSFTALDTSSGGGDTIYKLQGNISYTQVTQTDGWFILELWNDAEAFTGDPLISWVYETVPTGYEIIVEENGNYKVSMYRDFSRNGIYDALQDAYYETGTITISTPITIADITLIEP